MKDKCESCGGTGTDPDTGKTCPECCGEMEEPLSGREARKVRANGVHKERGHNET